MNPAARPRKGACQPKRAAQPGQAARQADTAHGYTADISQLSDLKAQSCPNEPLDSSETTSHTALRACVAALPAHRDANPTADASGATVSSRFRAWPTRAPLEASIPARRDSIAMVTRAAATAAVVINEENILIRLWRIAALNKTWCGRPGMTILAMRAMPTTYPSPDGKSITR